MSNPTTTAADGGTIARHLAQAVAGVTLDDVPQRAREVAAHDLLDAAGLCVASRQTTYMHALATGWDGVGGCTAIGQGRGFDAAGAATLNGTAIHGEDFDDTLEGAPIRVGAMVIPAVLAACERYGRTGRDALVGIVTGLEAVCRLNHVAPGAIHRAGFHPVGVIGPLGATVGVGVALGLDEDQLTNALGIAGSFSSGITEYLTAGSWTKRLHPGWAAQSGLRAALLGRAGFDGPDTVFEGPHNFFRAFAPDASPRYSYLTEGMGEQWLMQRIAFKPYACGTMIHPYIDCMIRLRDDGIDPRRIVSIECPTGAGLVDRLWEPLAAKHQPPTGYAAKFSMPFCMALGFYDRDAGLAQFTDARVHDPEVIELATKIHYVVDPDNEYPHNYSGHLRVRLDDGSTISKDQPHMRGGAREPLTEDELVAKFRANIGHGRWPAELGEHLLDFCLTIDRRHDLTDLADFGR